MSHSISMRYAMWMHWQWLWNRVCSMAMRTAHVPWKQWIWTEAFIFGTSRSSNGLRIWFDLMHVLHADKMLFYTLIKRRDGAAHTHKNVMSMDMSLSVEYDGVCIWAILLLYMTVYGNTHASNGFVAHRMTYSKNVCLFQFLFILFVFFFVSF